jgi:hypothetical protein
MNTEHEVTYLQGKNMGLSSHSINCSDPNNPTGGGDGFADHGDTFANSTSGTPKNSIVFDLKSLCDANGIGVSKNVNNQKFQLQNSIIIHIVAQNYL